MGLRKFRHLASAGLVGALVVAVGNLTAGAAPGRGLDQRAAAATYFQDPTAVAIAGQHVWVANQIASTDLVHPSGSITEIDSSTGAVLRVLSSSSDHLYGPDALADSGGRLYVGSFLNGCGCVTEIRAATGARVHFFFNMDWAYNGGVTSLAVTGGHPWVAEGNLGDIIELNAYTGRRDKTIVVNKVRIVYSDTRHPGPVSLASNGSDLFAVSANDSLVVISERTGLITETIKGTESHLNDPTDAVSLDGNLWVSNLDGTHALVEIDESTGAVVREISGSSIGLSGCTALATDGTHIWAADDDAVVEIDAMSGAELLYLSAASYGFDGVSSLATDGVHVWATNARGESVTEISNSSGALTRIITNPS